MRINIIFITSGGQLTINNCNFSHRNQLTTLQSILIIVGSWKFSIVIMILKGNFNSQVNDKQFKKDNILQVILNHHKQNK